MQRGSPHYDQGPFGTCEAFAFGRVLTKYFNSLLHFLPSATIADDPHNILLMEREAVHRVGDMRLRVLLDYFFIHLVQGIRRNNKRVPLVLNAMHLMRYRNPDVATVFKGRGNPEENTLLQEILTILARVPLKVKVFEGTTMLDQVRASIQAKTPVLVTIDYGRHNAHVVECIKVTSRYIRLQNSYEGDEYFDIALDDLDQFTYKGDAGYVESFTFFDCDSSPGATLHDARDYKRAHRAELAAWTAELKGLVRRFLSLRHGSVDTPVCRSRSSRRSSSSPRAVRERGALCDQIFRVLHVVFGVEKPKVEEIRASNPCLSMVEWVKLARKGFEGYAIEDRLINRMNKSVALVLENELERRIRVDNHEYLVVSLRQARQAADITEAEEEAVLRLFPDIKDDATRVHNRRTHQTIPLQDMTGRDPLNEILRILEGGNPTLKRILKNHLDSTIIL